jgi:hypothetical protein
MRLRQSSVQYLDFSWENSTFSLIIPLVSPFAGADVPEDLQEVLARLIVVPLHLNTTVEIHIVLPAVSAMTTDFKVPFRNYVGKFLTMFDPLLPV